MTKRQKVQEARLSEIDEEFLTLLRSCLRECAQGRYGLFGQNDHVDPDGRYWAWPDAKRVKNLAQEIKTLRHGFGQPNEVCERFIQLCSQRGPNVPGEPKLAAAFLAELSMETND